MASKRHVRRKACDGKVKFPNSQRAINAASSYWYTFHQHVNAYRCQFCNQWHIGHTPKRIRQMIKEKVERAGE